MTPQEKLLDRTPLPADDVMLGYEHAVLGFESIASGEWPAGEIDRMQAELAEWQRKNFGSAPPTYMALGMAEELGELAAGATEADHDDAIGDILIYAMQFATVNRLSMDSIFTFAGDHDDPDDADSEEMQKRGSEYVCIGVGLACHVALKSEQGIRGFPELKRLGAFAALATIVVGLSMLAGSELGGILNDTAARVLARDWTAAPADGGEVPS